MQVFCTRCGKKRAEEGTCPNCGHTETDTVPSKGFRETREVLRIPRVRVTGNHLLQAWLFTITLLLVILIIRLPGGETSQTEPQANRPPEISAPRSVEARIEPDPEGLTIVADPQRHHPFQVTTNKSVTISADAGGSPLRVHTDRGLPSDICQQALDPMGDTRLLIILPEGSREHTGPFYLVGCEKGEGTIYIDYEGEVIKTYAVTVQ